MVGPGTTFIPTTYATTTTTIQRIGTTMSGLVSPSTLESRNLYLYGDAERADLSPGFIPASDATSEQIKNCPALVSKP